MLDEALLDRWPLLERVKFLAIFCSNLDEFFMIRVAGLHEQLEAAVAENGADGLSPRDQLTRIAQIARRLVETGHRLFSSELLPALAKEGIHIRDWKSLSAETRKLACQYLPAGGVPGVDPAGGRSGPPVPVHLQPLAVARGRGPRSRDQGAQVRAGQGPREPAPLRAAGSLLAGEAAAAPPTTATSCLPLEQLIAANLEDLFPGMRARSAASPSGSRATWTSRSRRKAHDLLSIVDRRGAAAPLRGLRAAARSTPASPSASAALLKSKLEIDDEDVYESTGPLGLAA